jgi:hypothetical protein
LIATDGSELAAKAVAAGLELARVLGAKATAVTATEPWTTMVTAEPAFVFKGRSNSCRGRGSGAQTGRRVRNGACEGLPRRRHHRNGHGQGMRSHRHVVTRTLRSCEGSPGQPSLERTDALDDPRAHLPLTRRTGDYSCL